MINKFKYAVLVSIALLASIGIKAQNETLGWARSIGGNGYDLGASITTDSEGNVYSTGAFQGNADMDPFFGTSLYYTSAGGFDTYVQKVDPFGTLIWARTFGGSTNDVGLSIATDSDGNVYTTGHFLGTADFDPSEDVFELTPNGGRDIYIQKLDTDGNFIWAQSMGGTNDDYGYSIHVDSEDNIYTTGEFQGTMDLDPGVDELNFTSEGGDYIFIQKLDGEGDLLWATAMGTVNNCRGYAITTDLNGDVFTTGTYIGTMDVDPGEGVVELTSVNQFDIFVQKLDSDGNFLWAKGMGGSSWDIAQSITTDPQGNVFTAGYFSTTVDFDPGDGVSNLTSNGGRDIFIQKLNGDGDFQWAKSMGGSEDDFGYSISADANGNVYTTGEFKESADFDPGIGTANFTVLGVNPDIFIQKLDGDGNYLWAGKIGDTSWDTGQSVHTDDFGNVYLTGYFSGIIDFDPGAGVVNVPSNGGNSEIFTMRLISGDCLPVSSIDVQTSCGPYTWIDGITYEEDNNSATFDFINNDGCEETATLNLTVNEPSESIDSHVACDSFTWINGTTYTESNTIATHVIPNVAGCDSTITLNLTLNHSTSSTDVQTACESYTWLDGTTFTSSNNTAIHVIPNEAGCDSTITLDLTINQPTTAIDLRTECDSFTWINGTTYTESNSTDVHVIPNVAGCDSTITLNLTINQSTSGTDVQTACGSYTWINGTTYSSSIATETFVLQNTAGCDSTVTLDLTITPDMPTFSTDTHVACGMFTWIDGNTYTESNTSAIHVIPNVAGCDSTITLNLTLNQPSSSTDVQTACESFTWLNGNTYTSSNNTATHVVPNALGCDSTITLNLTIQNSFATDEQSSCGPYTWIDGNEYISSNNTATYTLPNTAGCDSLITLDLTVYDITSISVDGTTLTSNPSGLVYQWVDCDSNFEAIEGETNQSFEPASNGSFAVVVNNGICQDTSQCVTVTDVGIVSNTFNELIEIYPNPTSGNLVIDLGKKHENCSLQTSRY